MADSVATPTVTAQHMEGGKYHVYGTVAIGADPLEYATGGIAMSFLQAAIKATRTPIFVTVIGIAGFIYEYVFGTDASDGLLMIRAQTNAAAEDAPLGELAVAAIPAAVSGDTIKFHAVFEGML